MNNVVPVRVGIITDAVYFQNDGNTYSLDGVNGDRQWARYLRPEMHYVVYGRLKPGELEKNHAPMSDVQLRPLRYYNGLGAAIGHIPSLLVAAHKAVKEQDLLIIRMPGVVGLAFALQARIHRLPYAVELVGDIGDLFRNSESRGLRALAPLSGWLVRRAVRNASAVRYVTQTSLQDQFPSRAPTMGISNVQIPDEDFAPTSRPRDDLTMPLRLLCVGTQEFNYKGHDTAILALKHLRAKNFDATLTFIGEGKLSAHFRDLAKNSGVGNHITFLGHQENTQVFDAYKQHHMLLQPSLTEGLPRTVIEAMSQALPVLGSNVSGLPELLNPRFSIPPSNPVLLAEAIRELATPDTWVLESHRSLKESQRYKLSTLSEQFTQWIDLLVRVGSRR